MRKSLWHEIALVSAPMVLIGGLLGWNAWRNRARTPQIALKVTTQQLGLPAQDVRLASSSFLMPQFGTRFRWTAEVTGGPQVGYQFGWNEAVVVVTPRGPLFVWKRSKPAASWATDTIGGEIFSGGVKSVPAAFAKPNHAHFKWEHTIEEYIWPADSQSLEWRGEIVAIPNANDALWHSLEPSATLRNWATVAGAARWKRTIPLNVAPRQLQPVLLLKQKGNLRQLSNAKEQINVNVLTRSANWRTFRRLIAFDGKTRRTLWTNTDKNANIYLIGSGNVFGDRRGDLLAFDIGKIPTS